MYKICNKKLPTYSGYNKFKVQILKFLNQSFKFIGTSIMVGGAEPSTFLHGSEFRIVSEFHVIVYDN